MPFITSDNTNRRFFKIFVFGSLLYVLLHYYLFQKDQEGILENIKTYLYYAMIADLGIAYALDKFLHVPENKNEDKNKNENENEDENETLPNNANQKQQNAQANKYTPEQMAELEKKYIQWKIQQGLAEKPEQPKVTKKETKQDDTDFEDAENNSLPKLNKKQTTEKSEKSEKSKKSKQEDTDIPRFVKQRS